MSIAIPDDSTDRIVETDGVLGGQPRVVGTRIGVLDIVDLVLYGKYTIYDVSHDIHPELSTRDVTEAVLYYLLNDGTMRSKDKARRKVMPDEITGPRELPSSPDE